jgi:hypothetical protein
MNSASYPNFEKLTRVFDWVLGMTFSLIILGFLFLLAALIFVLLN